MDSNIVKNFRMRLKRYGFSNISIHRVHPSYDIYHVKFIDPNLHPYSMDLNETQMKYEPQVIFFNKYRFIY